jgi:hypothetical protein
VEPVVAARNEKKPKKKPSPATEEFITERVQHVEPSVVKPSQGRRTKLYVALGGLAVAGIIVALVIGFTGGSTEEVAASKPTTATPAAAPPVKSTPAPPPAKLTVESEPPKARVLIDGKPRCQTPCTVDGLPAQTASLLSIEKDGHLPWMALVVAGDPTQATQHAKLRKEPAKGAWGSVEIKSPAPANILVNGKPVGWITSAPTPLLLPPGDATLSFVPPHGEVKVKVSAGATSKVDLSSP